MSQIQDLTITTLADNLTMTDYLGQWGLSFLLELVDALGNNRKIIFDTGNHKESLLHNIEQMKRARKKDLDDVDCIVISHGHHDHTATTVEIVKASGGIRVYAHPHTFLSRFHEDKTGRRREHGVPKDERLENIERAGGEVILNTEPTEIMPGVWTTGQIRRVTSFEQLPLSKGERMIIVANGREIDDQILDDQALWMNLQGFGPFIITGCAHAGLVNTLLHVQRLNHFNGICGLVGGTHLVGRSEEYLQQTVKELEQFGLKLISPCHCTGFKAMTRLWQAFPEAFILNFSGRVIEVKKEIEKRVI